MPNPPAKAPAVEMKKTQPLVTMPQSAPQTAPLTTVAPAAGETFIDESPMSFCWAVLGIATVILLIQIWNYFA
jgi:hypothetical protein